MSRNTNVQTSNAKSQWKSPEVWDLSVGRTQGGFIPFLTEDETAPVGDFGDFPGELPSDDDSTSAS